MGQHRILCIVGARPQFIKHKPVVSALSARFETLTLHTGQHFDINMSDVFFEELEIPQPDFHLAEEIRSTLHGEQTAAMLTRIERTLLDLQPSAVLVYGDTNSTLAGALAAAKLQIPLLHVEAGLRSFNRTMPEEVNRVLTDHVSNLLFAPTDTAVANLRTEGVSHGVHCVGDVMCDVLEALSPMLGPPRDQAYILATVHRPSNADDPEKMRRILAAFQAAPYPVLLPLHPRTHGTLERHGISQGGYPNIEFISPLGYLDSLSHQKFAQAVVTDSGGIQKEAYLLKRPCFTLRTETEWVETLEGGCNILLGEQYEDLPGRLQEIHQPIFGQPYGDGHAAEKIAEITEKYLSKYPGFT